VESRDTLPDKSAADLARKVRRHLLPLLFLLYVVAYLDRINGGFAALNVNRELGLSSEQYGLLFGIFFCGYFLFEIPSNLILHRVGARSWIARILLTWGLVAVCIGPRVMENAGVMYGAVTTMAASAGQLRSR
jgi:ACS family tartrate transporter-like MFS transporter